MTKNEKKIIAEKTATAWEKLKRAEYINLTDPCDTNKDYYNMYLFMWSALEEICAAFDIKYEISDIAKKYARKIFELIYEG